PPPAGGAALAAGAVAAGAVVAGVAAAPLIPAGPPPPPTPTGPPVPPPTPRPPPPAAAPASPPPAAFTPTPPVPAGGPVVGRPASWSRRPCRAAAHWSTARFCPTGEALDLDQGLVPRPARAGGDRHRRRDGHCLVRQERQLGQLDDHDGRLRDHFR